MLLLGFGNNTTKAIDNQGPGYIEDPQIIKHTCDKLLWHSWQCSVALQEGSLIAWGIDPIGHHVGQINPSTLIRFIGHDSPKGYLTSDGSVFDLNGRSLCSEWSDVAINGQGTVFAINSHIQIFTTWSDFIDESAAYSVELPPWKSVRIYAMESRCVIHLDNHLFELKEKLRLIEPVEGLQFWVVPGRRNRLGIVTTAGDAYILGTRDDEPELLDVIGDVRLLGLGSDFEVVVTEAATLLRSEFDNSVRLTSEDGEEWKTLDVRADSVVDVSCGRWSTIFTVNA